MAGSVSGNLIALSIRYLAIRCSRSIPWGRRSPAIFHVVVQEGGEFLPRHRPGSSLARRLTVRAAVSWLDPAASPTTSVIGRLG
jgi:hypothetical protein